VGITPPPATHLDAFAAAHKTEDAKTEMRQLGVSVEFLSKLESGEGWNTKVTGHTEPVEVSFENFHLRREWYEQAAREGGMKGSLKWKERVLPDESQSKEWGVEMGDWESEKERPHFGILVVEK